MCLVQGADCYMGRGRGGGGVEPPLAETDLLWPERFTHENLLVFSSG